MTAPWLVIVPERFYEDHAGTFQQTSGEVIRRRGHLLTVRMTEAELLNLYDAAEYYVAIASDLDPEYFGLVSSARATVRRLRPIMRAVRAGNAA